MFSLKEVKMMEFTIQPELLPELARRCGMNTGPLSLITTEPSGTISPVGAEQILRVEGLVDDQGKVGEKYCREVTTLANPSSRLRIYAIQESSVLDFSSFSGKDGSKISCTVTDHGLTFRTPPDNESTIKWLSGIIGQSTYIQTPLSVTLPAKETLVLAAAIDLQRKGLLMSVIENRLGQILEFNSKDIEDILNISNNLTTTFVSLVRGVVEFNELVSDIEVQDALSLLSIKGHIKSTRPGMYSLSNSFFQIARQLKVFSTVLRVSYAGIDLHQKIRLTGFTAVQAGPTETVLIEYAHDNSSIRTLSSQEFIELIKILMEHPKWPDEDEEEERQDNVNLICPSCHAPLPPNAKFCRKCGKPVSTTAKDEMRT